MCHLSSLKKWYVGKMFFFLFVLFAYMYFQVKKETSILTMERMGKLYWYFIYIKLLATEVLHMFSPQASNI